MISSWITILRLAADLSAFIEGTDMVYEAHSTDYQTADALRQMVTDHFAILKVGPALTYAYREAVFALAMMEAALVPESKCSNLIDSGLCNALESNPLAQVLSWGSAGAAFCQAVQL